MRGGFLRHVLIFFYFIFSTNALHDFDKPSQDTQNLLTRLLGSESRKPVVMVFNLGTKARSYNDFDDLFNTQGDDVLFDDDDDDGYYNRVNYHRDNTDDDLYWLSHLMRNYEYTSYSSSSTSSEENLGRSGPSETAKQVLRTALRARCQKVDKCIQKCAPMKVSCQISCQQVFDNLNLCPPPTTTRDPCNKRPKCGRTMPPSWRF